MKYILNVIIFKEVSILLLKKVNPEYATFEGLDSVNFSAGDSCVHYFRPNLSSLMEVITEHNALNRAVCKLYIDTSTLTDNDRFPK